MTSPRDAYLAWQAEIGTAEVVLPAPWIRPPHHVPTPRDRGEATRTSSPVSSSPTVSSSSPASSSTSSAPADFFRDIERKLAEPARKKEAPKPAVTVSPPATYPLPPTFPSLDAYWSWLEGEYPRWFPGVSATLVRAEGALSPRLAVVELFPSGGTVFAGEAGLLLDKMMKAIELSRDALYLTSVMKTPPTAKTWARKDIARALPSFLSELKLSGCGVALLLGESCAQAVLRTGRSLESLAESPTESDGISFATTLHPTDLLRDPALKKPAWAHLKQLQTRLSGGNA